MLGLGIVGPLIPLYAKDLGATGIWLGAIFSGFSFARVIVVPMAGSLSDRWRRRKIFLTAGLSLYAVSSLGYLLANEVHELILVRMLHGFGSGMVMPIAMAYVGDMTPEGKEGTYAGNLNTAIFLGWGMGPMIGGILMDLYSRNTPFLAMSALTTSAFLLVLFILPEGTPKLSVNEQTSYTRILKNKMARGVVLFRIITSMGSGTLFSFLPLLAASMEMTTTEIGILLSSRVFLMSFLQKPFGTLTDRYSKTKMIMTGGLFGAISTLLIPVATNFSELLTLGVITGICWSVMMPAIGAIATELGRDYGMASMMSIFNVAMGIGMMMGPLIAGSMMETYGIGSVFIFGGTVGVAGVIFFYFLLK
jgi:MFS family permease